MPTSSLSNAQIADRVSSRAVERPSALAVVSGDASLTYSELNVRSNRLANFLISLEVRPGDLVAICLPRGIDSVVASLAALKAGAAYLPIDPAHDSERLGFVLGDAKPAALVLSKQIRICGGCEGLTTICLHEEAAVIARCSDETPQVSTGSDGLAYVIYTSGSTGRPKGVEITHAALLNLVEWHIAEFEIGHEDRGSQLASPSFDASVWEIWPYLAAGASVHIVDDKTRNDAPALRTWLARKQITACFAPTPLAEQLIRLRWPANTALRWLLTGADTLYSYPPSGLPFTLVNNYGPTECTVVATSGIVAARPESEKKPSIGRAISNTRTYVLDETLQQVKPGDIGELYLGGRGVARGYHNQPELTAERFLIDRFAGEPGAHMYRTGDQVRCMADGQLEFLGRTDSQVKVRGHRIELDEIVLAVNRCPGVRACAVSLREDSAAGKQMVAYVVVDSASPLREGGLRDFLRHQLPDYMQPALFIRMDSLPLNVNGKLDRAALPAPTDENIWREQPTVPPQNIIEERLVSIVSSLLALKSVSTHDNFFLLGGNSLLGTQMLTRIEEEHGIELSLRTLFDHPSVVELARVIEALQPSGLSVQLTSTPSCVQQVQGRDK